MSSLLCRDRKAFLTLGASLINGELRLQSKPAVMMASARISAGSAAILA
jgi:hypothetical protein